jgi:hypothetical protein
MRAAALLAVAVITAVGCGSSVAATPTGSETSLSITVWSEGRDQGPPLRLTLRCAPAGGTVQKPAAVCRRLAGMSKPFAPLAKEIICTDQYGGPQEAVVAGTYKGRRTWIQLTARNGCEISRWNRLAFLVPGAPGTHGGPA